MQDKIDQQRIESMYKMLLEMADGNFNYEIPSSGTEDTFESLVMLLNMLAKELKVSLSHWGYIDPHLMYRYLLDTTFVVDEAFMIECFTANVPPLLGYSPPGLHNRDFRGLLSTSSALLLAEAGDRLKDRPDYSTTLELTYLTADGTHVPSYCTLSRLLYDTRILISSVSIVVRDNVAASSLLSMPNEKILYRPDEAKRIQAIYDYIMENLEQQLPSGKELARRFGINELKLKLGFREFFNTSVYKLYSTERLKKAHVLINESAMPLQEISEIAGFTSYANFSKAFRKAYGYSPRSLRKTEL